MNIQSIAHELVTRPKGILAADASNNTMNKRLKKAGLPEDEETRRRYRQLLFTTPGIEDYISGVILYDETIHQKTDKGVLFIELLKEKGILPGIKVDEGLIPHGEETTTTGLAGLPGRLEEYKKMGAVFTKWRAVTTIDEENNLPTAEAIQHNSDILAEYAKIVQLKGMVPMVEPEVLLSGTHTLEKSKEVTEQVLSALFLELREEYVDLGAIILKSSMVLPGSESEDEADSLQIAKATNEVLTNAVPLEVPGTVFLSGGQSPLQATENLNEIAKLREVTFSYSRALQEPVLDAWKGDDANREKAQKIFLHRLKMNSFARLGEYTKEME